MPKFFDLEGFEDLFVEYDRACEAGQKAAHTAKLAITRRATKKLFEAVGDSGGIYIIEREVGRANSIKYIGLAGNFPNRFSARFRDENSLDRRADKLAPQDRMDLFYRRICISMNSSEDQKVKYLFQHFATHALFSGTKQIVFFPSLLAKPALESAENVLLFGAQAIGSHPFNQSKLKSVTRSLSGSEQLLAAIADHYRGADPTFSDLVTRLAKAVDTNVD